MGQGTDSCGGYDLDFNPYYEGLATGNWTMRDDSTISVSKMTSRHIRGAIRVCERAMQSATFSCDAELWESWIQLFNDELERRPARQTGKDIKHDSKVKESKVRGTQVMMRCHCGFEYPARIADLNRGWGYSCSKRCASVRRTYNKPRAIKIGSIK